MDEMLERYAGDVDFLLTDVCLTAAFYGLDAAVTGMAAHLRELSGKEGAAAVAQSLAKISVGDYPSAVRFADEVLDNPACADIHDQARQFRAVATQLAAGGRL